jgi:hypothetical protein
VLLWRVVGGDVKFLFRSSLRSIHMSHNSYITISRSSYIEARHYTYPIIISSISFKFSLSAFTFIISFITQSNSSTFLMYIQWIWIARFSYTWFLFLLSKIRVTSTVTSEKVGRGVDLCDS